MNIPLLAQMQTASPAPQIHDIAPPVYVFPYPMWMVYCAGAVLLAILVPAVWFIVRLAQRKPSAPPPTPRQVALAALEKARAQIHSTDPYTFSIAVSDILRDYISKQFNLRATQQTSPEFLASISGEQKFSKTEKDLLANFLEKCDLIKFARIEATANESAALLEQAISFVKGGAA